MFVRFKIQFIILSVIYNCRLQAILLKFISIANKSTTIIKLFNYELFLKCKFT